MSRRVNFLHLQSILLSPGRFATMPLLAVTDVRAVSGSSHLSACRIAKEIIVTMKDLVPCHELLECLVVELQAPCTCSVLSGFLLAPFQ